MRALSLYLLALALCCFLKKGYCGKKFTYEDFKSNSFTLYWAEEYFKDNVNGVEVHQKFLENGIDVGQTAVYRWLGKFKNEREADGAPDSGNFSTEWLNFSNPAPPFPQAPQIATQSSNFTSGNPGSSIPNKEAGGGTPNFQASVSASGNPGSSIPNKEAGGGSRQITFEDFKNDPRAMDLVEHFKNKHKPLELLKELEKINHKMCQQTMYNYLKKLNEEKVQEAGGGVPNLPATQIAGQSYNFTAGNPGSSKSVLNKGKSTNFSKAPGASSHYGGAMPSQQAPQMHGTDVPSQAGTDSTNWVEENSQNDDGSLYSVVRPKNTSSWKNAWGAVSSWFGASPQEPQFSPSMHVTPAASSYYSSNQPDDGSLESLITPRNQKDAPPFLQAPQIGRQSSNFTSGNPGASNRGKSTNFSKAPNSGNWSLSSITGSAPHYGGAIPFQQAPPMPGTLFPAFSNQSPNQSAPSQSTRRTGAVLSQPGTPSLDWSGGNSQNNDGDLASVVRPKNPSSSKGKSTSKSGKKPRN